MLFGVYSVFKLIHDVAKQKLLICFRVLNCGIGKCNGIGDMAIYWAVSGYT